MAGSARVPIERLEVVDTVTRDYAGASVQLELSKVVDRSTGRAFLDVIDGQGKPANVQGVEAAEERARAATHGKLHPNLSARAATMGPQERVEVAIWLTTPDPAVSRALIPAVAAPSGGDGEDEDDAGTGVWGAQPVSPGRDSADPAELTRARQAAEAADSARLAAVARHYDGARLGARAELASLGVPATAPRYSPVLVAALTRTQMERMAQRADVAMLYGASREAMRF
ncbi:MAG TPA: hypothetical protein VFX49_01140, partial [Chloroflexota bacterium]|nr:hypothetical protein [Chloroflexota bacterium]